MGVDRLILQGGPQGIDLPSAVLPVSMISEGARLRVGRHERDFVPIEELGLGDAVWDIRSNSPVDLDCIACATLGAQELMDQSMIAMRLPEGCGYVALPSRRLQAVVAGRDRVQTEPAAPMVFFRLWFGRSVILDTGLRRLQTID